VKVLIAEDDRISRLILQRILSDWGYDVTAVAGGVEAWQALQQDDAPRLVILDWVMPGMDGTEVCRKLRERPTPEPAYVLLLTSRDAKADIVAGLNSGANDYLSKPYDRDELQARVRVGRTVVELQQSLAPGFASWKTRWPRSSSCRGSCRSARTARRSATIRTTGSKSSATS